MSVLLSTQLPGLPSPTRGKVRDVYDLGDRLLIVVTDRISAYDCVLPTGIPEKGRVLNLLSAFWFEWMADFCPNHCLSVDRDEIRAALAAAGAAPPDDAFGGRAMLVRKANAFPVEFVVRGYVEGSAWKEYRASRSVCGIPLPEGLQQGSQLPEPIFTPATKATTGHDENITFERMLELGDAPRLKKAVELSRAVYSRAAAYARERGILIADTKFEFGELGGEVLMIDECLTPDSSRFWDAQTYQPGRSQVSFDKQFVRDYLDASGWNHEPPAPELPGEVVRQTSERYRQIYERLTGRPLPE